MKFGFLTAIVVLSTNMFASNLIVSCTEVDGSPSFGSGMTKNYQANSVQVSHEGTITISRNIGRGGSPLVTARISNSNCTIAPEVNDANSYNE